MHSVLPGRGGDGRYLGASSQQSSGESAELRILKTPEPRQAPEVPGWLGRNQGKLMRALICLPLVHVFSIVLVVVVIGPLLPPGPRSVVEWYIFAYQLLIFSKIMNIAFVGNFVAFRRLWKFAHKCVYSDLVPENSDMKFRDVVHVVIVPIYKEPIDKLRETLNTLKAQADGMARQIVVVIATEERDTSGTLMTRTLHKEYSPFFKGCFCTVHRLEKGEAAGKSSNENWAARCVKYHLVDRMGIDMNRVILTTCDADTFFPRGWSAEVVWRYCTAGPHKRHLRIWQAPIFCVANLHDIRSTIARLRYTFIGIGYTLGIFTPYQGRRIDLGVPPFSSYTLSLCLAHRAAYWNPSVIPEDAEMFLRCQFATGGQVEVRPLDKLIGADAPVGHSSWVSLREAYNQHKRWGYGGVIFANALYYSLVNVVHGRDLPAAANAGPLGRRHRSSTADSVDSEEDAERGLVMNPPPADGTSADATSAVPFVRMPLYKMLCVIAMAYDANLSFPVCWLYIFATAIYGVPSFIPLPLTVLWGLIWPVSDYFYREVILMRTLDPAVAQCSWRKRSKMFQYVWWPLTFCLIPVTELIFSVAANVHAHIEIALNPNVEYKTTVKVARSASSANAVGMAKRASDAALNGATRPRRDANLLRASNDEMSSAATGQSIRARSNSVDFNHSRAVGLPIGV